MTQSTSNTPVTSTEREMCWQARDFYLSCLNSSVDSEQLYKTLKECKGPLDEIIPSQLKSEECARLRSEMYSKCPDSWAEHFEKKFRGDKLKEYQLRKLKEIGASEL